MASSWSHIPTHNTNVDIDEAEKSNSSLYPRKVRQERYNPNQIQILAHYM